MSLIANILQLNVYASIGVSFDFGVFVNEMSSQIWALPNQHPSVAINGENVVPYELVISKFQHSLMQDLTTVDEGALDAAIKLATQRMEMYKEDNATATKVTKRAPTKGKGDGNQATAEPKQHAVP